MTIKKTLKKLTSKKAKKKYKKIGSLLKKIGENSSRYLKATNNALDNTIGTYDPTPKRILSGVRVPRGYKLVRKRRRIY